MQTNSCHRYQAVRLNEYMYLPKNTIYMYIPEQEHVRWGQTDCIDGRTTIRRQGLTYSVHLRDVSLDKLLNAFPCFMYMYTVQCHVHVHVHVSYEARGVISPFALNQNIYHCLLFKQIPKLPSIKY